MAAVGSRSRGVQGGPGGSRPISTASGRRKCLKHFVFVRSLKLPHCPKYSALQSYDPIKT